MPNIPQYTSQVRPARRSAAQSAAAAGIGEAQRDMFRTLGDQVRSTTEFVDRQQGQRETSKLTKDYADTVTGLAKDWDEFARTADSNDTELADKWINDRLDPALEKFGEGVWSTGGQELRENLTSRMKLHFFEKTTADQMAIAGAAVQSNLEQSANTLAIGARVDPSSMQMSIDAFNDMLEAQIAQHNLTAAQAAQMREQVGGRAATAIALSAALGMAERNPAAAKAELAKGKDAVFGKYLDAAGIERVTEAITEQERALEIESNRKEREYEKIRQEAAEESANNYTTRILLDPTKVSPKDIANDPSLDSVQKRVISNFLDEELRKAKGPSDGEENKGPGFWNAYQRVFANGYKSVDEIYAQAGPGKPLTLQGANALATLWRGRRNGERAGDYQAERVKSFFDGMHRKMTRNQFGTEIAGGEEAWRRFYFDKTRQIDERGDKSLDVLIDEKSTDYIGKDYESYLPPKPASSGYVPATEPAERSWMDFFGGLIGGGPAPSTKEMDSKFKDGEEGAEAGRAALKAALAGGLSMEEATAYGIKRGWLRPSEPKLTAPDYSK